MTKTKEKTMEWEKKFDKKFMQTLFDKPKVKGMSSSIFPGIRCHIDEVKSFIKSLLASSQDSFRRKVETEVIGKDESEDVEEGLRNAWFIARNSVRDEQRAKLKEVKI